MTLEIDRLGIPVRRYSLDEGASLYARWARGIDGFDSPAFKDPSAFLDWLRDNDPVLGTLEDFRSKIGALLSELQLLEPTLDLSRKAFDSAFASINKLKCGEDLDNEECKQLYDIFSFILVL